MTLHLDVFAARREEDLIVQLGRIGDRSDVERREMTLLRIACLFFSTSIGFAFVLCSSGGDDRHRCTDRSPCRCTRLMASLVFTHY